jgi:hypothetical protein
MYSFNALKKNGYGEFKRFLFDEGSFRSETYVFQDTPKTYFVISQSLTLIPPHTKKGG